MMRCCVLNLEVFGVNFEFVCPCYKQMFYFRKVNLRLSSFKTPQESFFFPLNFQEMDYRKK